jgi:copper/silver efflux system protein
MARAAIKDNLSYAAFNFWSYPFLRAFGPLYARMLIYLDNALTELKKRREREGRCFSSGDLYDAIMSGAVERVRPKMMTVAAIMAGLLPIMWHHGTGAEVMQRIAVPMIGGMVSSTLLTLVVIPAIYAVVKGVGLRPSRRNVMEEAGTEVA